MEVAGDGSIAGTDKVERLIADLGELHFGQSVLGYWEKACRPDYCSIYRIGRKAARSVATAGTDGSEFARRQVALYLPRWQRDPMVATAQQQLMLNPETIVHTAVADLPMEDFRDVLYDDADICDRVLFCSRSEEGMTSLSFLRRHCSGAFNAEDISALDRNMPLLATAVKKHIEIVARCPDLSLMLGHIERIRGCVAASGVPFSRRELDVCARLLYGMSIYGTSVDLSIGQETVITYKKRALARIGLASQREFLLWYIETYRRMYSFDVAARE